MLICLVGSDILGCKGYNGVFNTEKRLVFGKNDYCKQVGAKQGSNAKWGISWVLVVLRYQLTRDNNAIWPNNIAPSLFDNEH